jgi:hypothetical protein
MNLHRLDPRGQDRHRPDLGVLSPQRARRLWTLSAGLVEVAKHAYWGSALTSLLGVGLVFSFGAVGDAPDVAIRVGEGSAVPAPLPAKVSVVVVDK